MPTDAKPLFRPEALRVKLLHFVRPPEVLRAGENVRRWAANLAGTSGDAFKETEQLPEFLRDIFVSLLGYTARDSGEKIFNYRRESLITVDGKRADAALGQFDRSGGESLFTAVIEGKGPRDPLDRPFAGRKRSAVEQALQYAVNLQIDWFIVTNFQELRLYHKGHDLQTYERFELARLALDDDELKRFVFLLGADRMLAPAGNHLDALLAESAKIGRELTNDYYREYAELRRNAFDKLRDANPKIPPADLLAAAQKILDRVLFIAFAEDRGLLPAQSIHRAFRHADEYNPRPVWDNFRALFKWVNEGNAKQSIERYNGGLFAPDPLLESLTVPDVVCRGFDRLAAYEYGSPTDKTDAQFVDVEILGHIFEQSIADLEELQRQITADPDAPPTKTGPTKRKKEGAFYTPAFVTRYIVQATLGPVLADRFERYRKDARGAAPAALRALLDDPRTIDTTGLKAKEKATLAKFWNGWHDELRTVRIVDPACGSGAFLIEAFEQLFAEYRRTVDRAREVGGPDLFDLDREILESNLFGMDLNSEAVEICRLSLWIKTARKGKVLTTLDANIVQGNSIVGHPSPMAAWQARFPGPFADGGFDVVIGNPPYVRQEWIAKDKPYLQEHYRAYDGVADLYVYFYELGMNVLKPGGRLGFISSNSFLRAAFAVPLRQLLKRAASLEKLIDLGDTQVFEDAKDVYPAIVVAAKQASRPKTEFVTVRVRRGERVDLIEKLIEENSQTIAVQSLDDSGWVLDDPKLSLLRKKLLSIGQPLSEAAGGPLFRGLITGLNEGFVVDAESRKQITRDGKSHEILRPFVAGTNVRRWIVQDPGEWVIAIPSGVTRRLAKTDDPTICWDWLNRTYPGVAAHLAPFEDKARSRLDQGEFWWELRSCDYYDAFDKPKIIYPDIAKDNRFAFDKTCAYARNTAYFFPSEDLWLLAVLNSPTTWFVLSGISTAFGERRGEFRYRLFTQYVERLPIPTPRAKTRDEARKAVLRILTLAADCNSGQANTLDWLRHEFEVEKPTQRLADVVALDADGFIGEVRKVRGKQKPLTVAGIKRLKDEHAKTVEPLRTAAAEAAALERRVADLVNEAYGLTPDEVALMWKTAPPRMPVGPPTGG
ncbi:MAG: N-6 DNA methylase [Gemmataceae bacterium]|nr:N-6 DNA methylase [Gemmataceae bacterium]